MDKKVAVTPHLSIRERDNSILLYEGLASLNQGDYSTQASVTMRFVLSLKPYIRFDAPQLEEYSKISTGELSLGLCDGTTIDRAFLTRRNSSHGSQCLESASGTIVSRVMIERDAPVKSARFQVPNLRFFIGHPISYTSRQGRDRIVLHGNDWIITLDAVENKKAVEEILIENTHSNITHIGKIEKETGTSFTEKEVKVVAEGLFWYLSFCEGRWTGPLFLTGFDSDESQLWQVWDSLRISPFENETSWADGHHVDHIELPFGKFLEFWLDEAWREVIRVAIHWYVEAKNQIGSIEGSIALAQTAFELLSSFVLVENFNWISQNAHNKMPAADRIRLLLRWASIPTDIPSALSNLKRQANEQNWSDIPDAIVQVRNSIVHPTRKNREKLKKYQLKVRIDTWKVSVWILELLLLRLLDYQGTYHNRLIHQHVGEAEEVPWA